MSEIKERVREETESKEMYLKTIYQLWVKNGHVCVTDIAAELSYSNPSVTKALKRLRNLDYVRYSEGVREIELTEKGKEIAQKLCERYEFFVQMLELNGIEAELPKKRRVELNTPYLTTFMRY